MTDTVAVNRLSVLFQNVSHALTAVDEVSFCIHPGETLALLGESGCGKSLTSLALMRLLPSFAVYGRESQIIKEGDDLLNIPEQVMKGLRGRRIAMIFQEPMAALNPVMTIGAQLAEAILAHQPMNRVVLQRQSLALLREVELPEPERRLLQFPHQLSGGQKQRVLIAMALANRPDLLIADEPTTALDVTIQAQILLLLKKLQRQYHMSMLLITHDLGVVRAMADRVCVMYAGQLVELAARDAFFQQPMHPYAQQLFFSLPSFERRKQQLPVIEGSVPRLDAMPSGCRFHPRCAHAFLPCQSLLPKMQTLPDGRLVRCHLYPKHTKPPPLLLSLKAWQEDSRHTDKLLEVRSLVVYFQNAQSIFRRSSIACKAVDGLSFTLHQGKTLALVGESGCGKTTVGKALVRLQAITSGEVLYRQDDVSKLSGHRLRQFRKKIQIVFQDPFASMNPRMTIEEILSEGLRGMSAAKIRLRLHALLDQVNLPNSSLKRYPHQFSGGQRQRICIARALATEPEVLICDEPTSALDVSVQAQILNLLKLLQQELGLSYLFITHNMGVVSYIADDVLVMREGKIVEHGTYADIVTQPKHDYTKHLLSSVLRVEG